MALPSSGPISLADVNVELGLSATAQISLNDSAVRTLFGKPSGAISMSDGYGKANQFAFTISSNQTNANLRTLAVNAGWNQTSKVVATINSGIYISSNSTATPGLTINGSFPNGVELVNNGFIIGMGGNGANGVAAQTANSGAAGGLALSVASAISVRNNGTIGGGGGGGGGGGAAQYQIGNDPKSTITIYVAGGGGGGGRSSAAANSAGGSTPGVGSTGATNGSPGTVSAPGSGGIGTADNNERGGTGGTGGQWGAAGATGSAAANPGGAGGGGGAAVSGNGNITWLATGTRLGAIA